jgi:hypothetical protein
MGSLTYDGMIVHFDDRVLAHVQIVIVQKLRRGESFLMSWRDSDSVGDGRSSIWLNLSIPLYFKFAGGHAPDINRDWIMALASSADSPRGLIVSSEHDSTRYADNELRPGAETPAMSATHSTIVDPGKLDHH